MANERDILENAGKVPKVVADQIAVSEYNQCLISDKVMNISNFQNEKGIAAFEI